MNVLQLKWTTENGKIAINNEIKKIQHNWKIKFMRAGLASIGAKFKFYDGEITFYIFVFKVMPVDDKQYNNPESERYKELGMGDIKKSLEKHNCLIDKDYTIKFIEDER